MIRREQQRFSLRKYKVGVASVFLGTTLSFLMANGGAVKASEIVAQTNSGETAGLVDKEKPKEEILGSDKAVAKETSESKVESLKTEDVKSESTGVTSEEAKPVTSQAKSEESKDLSSEAKADSAKPAATSKAEEVVVAKPKAEEKTETKPEEKSESKAKLSAVAEATSLDTNASAANVEAKPLVDTETLALAAENTVNAGALATNGGRRRNRRAATEEVVSGDHNSKPIAVTTYLKDGEVATPNMTDSNGASVRSQTVPAGYSAKEGDWYTYAIWDLTEFNKRYGTKYYARAYKRFDESTDTNVDLINKTTGAVVETRTITASSGVQKFTTTTAASNSQLTFQVDYKAGTAEKGKTTQPFIQNGYEVGKSITDLVAAGHTLTPAEQTLYNAVYNARTTTDVLNVVEPAYNGRTITDSNAKIPETINKTTYYKVVDKNNPTFNANKTDKTVQDYKENGNEVDLARYTLKAEEGQRFTASGERQFDGYKLYQRADANDKSGFVNRPYTIGSKFMDADRYGIKRIKEVVGEDGSVVIRVYLLDPRQQSKRSDGSLSTDGYMLLAETKPIKPGENNTQELVVKKTPLNTIAHTVTDPKTGAKTNYPNGKEVTFDFQKAAGYTPYKSVFVPFLGDGIGHGSANAQLERGVGGIGTNVDLLNTLTPYKQPIYYYVKQDPVQVTPEVEKQLEGRSLKDGEFTFKLTEDKSSPDRYEETVTNKSGKATFSKLTFNKAGTYRYKITEVKGSDTNVDYDAMTVTMTVTVTENSKGDLQATTTYSAEGGFKSSENDKIFNNYVVAPVKTKFDFSKALAGRELKAGEFTFQLKDSKGTVLQTKTNTKAGVIAFDDLTFNNTQVGTHKYTVEEVIPTSKEAGMTYDTMKAEVTITVTKSGHALTAVAALPADKEFNNTFTPAPVKVNLEFDKSLSNGTLNAGDFSFTLTGDNNVSETVTNKANGKINFSELSFDKVGVYNYTVKEVKGNKADVDYDAMTIAVKVTVTKDATTGLLSAKTEMTSTGGEATGADDKVFNNHVVAPVTAQFDFSKALAGRKLKAGEFSFVLKNSEGTVLQTKQNDADGKVKFDALTFTNTQVGNHKYTVEEVIPETKEAGMTYDTMKANVTVSVTKSGHALTAVATLPQDKEFNNTFTPTATQVQFKFTKRLEGKELTKDAFTFELLENGNVIQTKKNAADGTIQFDAIAYDQEGRHTYTVREVAGADTNIDYDSMNAVVTVNVTKDAASGTLTANVTMPEDSEFNNYVVAPVTAQFDFSKALAGRKLKAGEFSFVLKNSEGTVLQTKQNDANGKVSFDALTFSNTQVGNHKYTVEEVIPETKETGMTYDTMKAVVTITVTKSGHALTATKLLPTDTEFNNTFTPSATTAQFSFTKRLEGKTLEANAFTFELLENGNVIQTKKNAQDGTITFDAISYAQEGTHTYTVREVAGDDTNIDYDSMNAVVTVTVTKDAATGLLSAKVSMPEDTEFNNYVVAPVVAKFDFTKKLAGRALQAGEFSFVLKNAAGEEVETVTNKEDGTVTFTELSFDNTKVGTHTYTVEEVIPASKELGMTYDTMKATITVEVSKKGHALTTVTNVTSTGGVDADGASTDGTADKEFNNKVTPPEAPQFQPEKFVLNTEKYDLTGEKLLDDDDELTDEYGETNADPYADTAEHNEAENINTKTVERGDKLVYQVWLDTTKFTSQNNVQYVGISDKYDAEKLTVEASSIKAYDGKTGLDVTDKFDITVENGVITATSKKEFVNGDNVIDTTKFAFGRYYKFDIPATVKDTVKAGADIENSANQIVHVYNPVSKTVEKPEKPTQKRVNTVPVTVDLKFTKKLEGRVLTAGEFSFVLKKDKVAVETVQNDAEGKITFKTLKFGKDDLGKTYTYTVSEITGSDSTVTYDDMVATVTIKVAHDGTAKAIVASVTDAPDKEFNNRVIPPDVPQFQPKKYVLDQEKFDIKGDSLLDDDEELQDEVAETNKNPYVDGYDNNEDGNINTYAVRRGDRIVYQVWLDTTKFDLNNKDNIQTVGITDDYDETNVDVKASDIKAYDSATGLDVTDKFDIKVENGVMTATLKAGFTKSLGDAENTQIIDTTKFAFGRYYKFDISATVKADVEGGVDIENTAAQIVHYYNPTSKTVEKPNKPTQKRVNSVPIEVEFNFTKKLEGRELKAGEFTFELRREDGEVIERVKNDKDGKVKFESLEFMKGDEGTHKFTIVEVPGTDATVTYDPMEAEVTVEISYNGKAKALVKTVTDAPDKEFNNVVTPPEEPKFQPEKYVVSEEKFDITGDKLLDDDSELTDKYGETNTNPYVDGTSNNEAQNLNTKTVKPGAKLVYQVWLDTTKFDAANKDNIQTVSISDDFDETKVNVDASAIKAYDSVTGADVTDKFDIKIENGVMTATLKAGFTKSLGDAENTQVIDTTKFAFGRYYKFDIPATVKADVTAGADIENTAAQVVNYYNPTSKTVEKPSKPTEKRVNSVPVQVEFNFTKRLEGRELKANEFSFVLKDSEGKTLETVTNDASGNVKFSAIEFKKEQAGVHNYTVEEVAGTDATVTYDTMKANVTVTVKHDGTAKVLVATVGDIADKEFNNRVTPPEEPKFQPEKYVLNEEKFSITDNKLLDDDSELTDKYGETNTNPYVDGTDNNEAQNINTKTVKRGQKLYYQVWLDTTKFDAANKDNVQSVGITDDFDETKVDVDASAIKAYDSVSGADVTDKFDIKVENGVMTATLKGGFTKSLGDAENTQIIDTTKFAFGRYYKFDIPTTVKADVAAGVDIENTAAQVVNYYNPTSKTVEKPSKPTEKRVNSVPVQVEFNFTKRLEGRELKANEFSFVLKDSEGKTLETVTNDASGNVKFSAIEFKKEQAGVHNYTVEEVAGTDATVTYDTMKANVTVTVSHDGTAKVLVATVGEIADKEFNNRVTPPEEPKFQPEKYVLNEEKFSITDNKLLDDDKELKDKVADTNANPYADDASNNEAENINTKTVKRGDKLVYQVWLDTTKFDAANKDNIQSVGISDDYDETKLDLDVTKIKAYDSVTGDDVTAKFDITVEGGVITATLKAGFTKSLGDAENTQIIDTTKFAFGRYYKFDIPATVKADVKGGVDIENTAAQVVNYYNPTTKKVEKPNKPTEKRVNSVPVQVEFNFTKRLEGRELKANEFSFVLKDSTGKVVETVTNDASGNVKFSAIEFKKDQAGVHNYTVEEVAGTDATVTYDTMKANVTVTVKHDGTAKVLVATVGDIADKEFNNRVTPPEEPKFQPEKYVLNEEKFSITDNKLLDDDSELTDKYGETNTNPYVDGTDNNEAQNINTKTVKPGAKLVYQVWLDTTKFDAANKDNIQSVGISDDYDETKLDLDATKIKAYDSVTGDDVTAKFDITVEGGVITATLKAGFTKSLGDAENTQIIDTTKLAFGRYYKFDIPATVKADVKGGVDIENTAAQVVNYYNPTTKKVEKPNKPTEKRVNSVPVQVEFNFTKRLEGRELKANEFSFVLKDSTGKVVETVTNDASGNVKFSAIEFKKDQAGVHNYTVEEVAGTDATVTYDTMKANVTVTVKHDGTAKVLVATVGDIADKEFNNRVTPPEEPKFQPEKYVLNEEKFSITDNKLLDDDSELTDKYGETNTNPYVDGTDNNEAQNINTKTVKRGQKLYYQVWLDTTKFDAANKDNVQSVGITDDFDETKVDVDASAIKAYDSVSGADVTDKFDIKVENGVMTATLKGGFTKSLGDAENTQIIDTTKFEFGRYYKFDIPATVKADVKGGVDIENTAAQVVNYYNPTSKTVEKPSKPTEKRVNSVPVQVEFNFTKRLEGRELKANEFSFVLKDSEGKTLETVTNDASGNVKFKAIEYKKGQEGTYKYTIEEVKGTDATVTYDSMKAEVTVVVEHNGKAKALVKTVTDATDKEFNNRVTPPEEPKFQPEKYVLNEEKFSITDNKLLDDDSELTDKYGETNTNPYVDGTDNNEAQNINTKTVKRGQKLYYQVWLDTTKFDAANKDNVQSVGITDDFDETKVDVDASAIKAYDSVSGADVTDKFDIKVENGVMTATLKGGFTKSLGDAENTQIIDTTKFAFGRYYKFDIPTTVKADVAAGVDIENTAAQVVNYYNPTSKTVEKPSKPTEKRVNSVPVQVEFNFTKRLEGRELKANEFSFVLKDSEGKTLETVTNDASGNVKFSAIEFKKEQAGVHNYTVEEVAGTDATVTYDTMKANVTVTVSHDGTAKVLVATVGEIADKEFNNRVTPPEEPKFQPEKYVLNEEKFSITDNKLLDDDKELKDKVADTNANPYADDASNNEAENINTKTVKRGAKLVYQVWLDTTKFDAANKDNIQSVGISDDYDETKLDLDVTKIKAYDSVTGDDVTAKFDITVEGGVITATLKAGFTKSLGDAENTQIIDTTKFAFGRYYKFDIPATVKADVKGGVDIENTAAQVVNYYNPTTKKVEKPNKPTEKRVNSVPVQVEFNFTKRLEGRELKANEFSFVLKDSTGKVVETVTNDASGNVKFSAIEFKKDQAGVHNYTVEEVAGTDATVTYDTMKANVTVTVKHDGTAKVLVATVGDIADKEFNNRVTPPEEPKFQPEKYVLNEEKFSITDNKLLDDDSELTDKYGETNTNPYVDGTDNNEAQNINTKTVKPGAKLVYQVWLDTTKFDAANKDNIQSVGISDDYDETKLDLDATKIKAYDSVTGDDVTAKFDITVEGGVITATLKAGFTKSLGDAENTQIIDTTKLAFGRYYKFDIPATVKADVKGGVDIENTAAQVVNYYNPTTKKVEKPNKPTEKRVNSVPVQVEFNFTKRLEGRELKANEFSFVLKDSTGKVVETVTNDASGNVKFSAIEFKKDQAGVHNYTVEEVAGTDATVTYDTMKANVTVTVKHDGTAKVLVATVGDIADKEFNNRVTPPEEPKFQPEKYVLNEEKFSITDNKLLDDDSELTDKYGETNTNPYVDGTDNNEAQNINTKTVKRGQKLYYQVWLDTTKFDAANKDNVQSVGITDDFDETKVDVDASAIKAYDSVSGADVTDKFDIKVENGVMTATLKGGFTKSLGDAENTQIIDTTKFEFGRYYKFDIPATVKADVKGGVDIENTAAQVVNYYNPTSKTVEKPSKPTEKRVNSVPVQVEFNFTKRLEGRELKANEFSFVLKDSEGKTLETVTNDASGNVKFKAIEYKKGQEGTYKYTIEEVKGTDATVTYDSMKAEVTVVVEHNGKAKALVKTVTDATDKEFNNRVTPPEEPKFQPEKYVLNEEKFSITDNKLLDDDSELTDKYGETNTNPYVDGTDNNEAQNINTKTVKRGQKLYYQVWLDTTKFDAANKDNVQSVGITDDFDETKVDVDASAIKAYDSVSGADVTDKFDIKVENGVMTATLKGGFTKSLGDAENTQIIDTTKFAFGRYYKFDIPTTVKADVAAGVDIENTAAQVVNYYNPTSKTVEKPSKPTEKRVNSVPVQVEFNFTKRLEGRELKANEFSFVLKDSEGKTLETVTNDASGNVKFSAIEFKKEQAGVHNYTVEEVAGTDATVTYDTMKANVTVTVSHDGTAKVLVATVGEIADKEFNNRVTPPEEPKFQPEKYVLNEEKFSITDNKLLDDDKELKDKVADTNANPYADDASNNEAENINTKTVKRGDKLVYQVWLDTTKFDAANKDNIQSVGISDDYDETKLDLDVTKIKAYDSVTGDDVTAKFDITVEGGVITATLKAGFTKSLGDAENTQIIDTTKFAFGRYYKFDIPATVKADVKGGVDIENTAAQVVNYYNPTTKKVEKPNKPTEKRVNSVPVQVEFNFTKRLEGRELKANEFSFVLKDSTGKVVETVTNDASGNVKFSAIEFKKDQAGVHNYTVEEVAGTDATVTYDTMKANVTVTVKHDGTAKVLVATVGDIADKEFNNRVTPPEEPKFQPEKYVLNEEKFSITDNKLLDDDSELTDKYGETNTNPYVDGTDNNEAQNINTKTVKPGAKLVYQVWLDTTKFDAANKDNIQSVGISDDYDETKLDLDATKIKAYDSVTGDDVTAKFDITVEGGVITATLKAGFTKSLGDAENTQIIDTTKLAFGRYYKFDIPATVKADVKGGVDIENTAAQVVNYYNPTTKKVEKPNKPTEKRVNSVPVQVEFNFTKRLEGRELKANEFSFVLKDSTGKVVETVTNDASGNVKFSAIEFKKDQAGVHNYTVEEVAGTDATVTYDTMKANVTVTVKHDGTAKVLVATVGDIADKEFNNRVTPPEEPKFQPEKYVLNEEKFSITDNKLLDDDSELTDKYGETNTNPYVDGTDNNEAQNINTKTVKRGQKLYYQVWLDTTKFDAANKDNVQSVGITDDFDETKVDVDASAIKAYDSVSGADVTDKFDIKVENGVMTATLKGGFTKSLGDAENTQIIDTTKFEFGRYYKFDIPATVKADVKGGVDIENTAAQVVNYYNPTSKTVEKPSKPTEKRVNSVPVQVEFNFTKRLEGRELKANEFSFVLKDSEGKTLETVTNDASGNVKFKAIEYKKGQEGTYKYTIEEVKGTDATVTYDSMKAEVTVVVEHNGKAKALVKTVTDATDKEFNNRVTPPEEPKFQPEKYVLNEEKFSITDNKLLDDDSELTDKYGETNTNPYVDGTDNNEAQNINTKTVKRGQKLYYQVWLDTTKFDAANKDNVQSVGITDDFDETKVDVDASAIKAYDSVSGADVTDKFDIKVENGVMTATLKGGFTKSLGDAENTQIIDTTKFAFGRYYKFDIPTTVKADVAAGVDIENTAAQVVNYYNPTSKTVEKPSKPTEKRVNSVPVQVEFNFTKRLEGRELKANEFSFVLKDSEGKTLETVTNDASGNVKFSAIEFKKEQAGVHNYTVEEVAGTDATVTYDTMKANVTVTVKHDGTAKVLVATVGEIADKEFNNRVTPPEEPKFQPEKYVLNEEKFSITDNKLLDDDKELKDKVADTNANPYADDASNNEAENINTKTVKRGDKLVYQVWLDTTKFDAANKDNIQSVGISDDYDETKLDLDVTKIKAYDSVTGDDVTAKFDITVEGGVITATLKAGFTKSLGDAENTQIIDTTKFAFGRYYKFDIPATVKADVKGGVDIENTAAQVVNYYNPTTKKVEKPNKPTEKRVNSVPVQVEFNFTKRLEGRELKANEFSFVLKDSTGKVVETVTNDASGNVKFSAIEFKKDQAGVHNYTVEEVKGTDGTVTYDAMKAVVTVEVKHDGTAKALITNVTDPADKEFNNKVTPPETPEFNPEKYILSESKFDLTGVKLLDDDSELKDKVADTNANPYADGTANNEVQNINTKTLKKGDKVYYQVWLDTTKFTEAHNIQSVGVTDKYDSANLNVNGADIKAYDSVTGEDVTAKFDIKVENGVITATSKADLTKSLGDAENTQVIDTTKLAFGRYYKFEIPAEIKQSAQEGVDIENTASQIVHQYDPTKKSVEKPEKPTEKRVVNIPVKVQFQFTKKLEGRELKAGEFSFVLKDEKGNVIETVTNDAAGKIQFSALEFKRGEEGTHLYHVEEIRGTDSSVVYDKMVATVGIVVKKDGKVLVATTQLPEDTEFNNKVTPPTPPTPVTPPTPEKPKGRELPNTGEKSTAGVAALGAALGLAGLGLVVKRKKEDEA